MTATELMPYLIPAAIGGTGWLVKVGISASVKRFEDSVSSLDDRLSKIEGILHDAVKQVTTVIVRSDTHGAEIDKLRLKVHELEGDVAAIDTVQSRCRVCSPRV